MDDDVKVRYPAAVASGLVAAFAVLAVLPSFVRSVDALVGKAAPPLDVPLVANDERPRFVLGEQRGKVVVIEFWATWCPTCRNAAHALEAVQRKDADAPAVVAVAIGDDDAALAKFARTSGVGYAIAADRDDSAAKPFGIKSIPSYVVVDRDGIVRGVKVGAPRGDELLAMVREAGETATR